MQASAHVSLGYNSAEHIIRPTLAFLVFANDWLFSIRPWIRSDLLSKSSLGLEPQMKLLHADSHASNKLLISRVAENTDENGPVFDGLCLGHKLS